MSFLSSALTSILLLTASVSGLDHPVIGIPVILENNTTQEQAVTLIWYSPLRRGNSTEQLTMAPGERITRRYPAGTKLYRASEEETDLVMNGGRLDSQAPFLQVSLKSNREIYPLF